MVTNGEEESGRRKVLDERIGGKTEAGMLTTLLG